VSTNACGTATTSAATLTVNVAPAVTTQPTNQIVCAGGTATFTAAASGTPAATVQWQVDSGSGFTNIPGATSPTLSFATVAAAYGSTTTSAATLVIDTLPAVTTDPVSQAVCPGGTATFTAAATSNAGDHTVQWQVNTGSGFADLPGETATTLSFPVAPADNGNQ